MIKSERFPIKIVVTYLLIFTIFLSSCTLYFIEDRPYREATKKELEIFYSAVDTNNVTLCYKLDPRAEKRIQYYWDEPTFPLRPHCLYTIAIQTKNPKICDEMSDISNMEETFKPYKDVCIKEASR